MTIAINHAFVSLKGDGTDSTQVQPSNWNAAHNLTLASGNILGRLSAGAGAAEEIPISAYMVGLLSAPDAPTLAGLLGLFTTGDVKYTFSGTAPAGWLLLTGTSMTIGNTSSGASLRANADTQNLFTLLYTQCADSLAPVSGGRTGNATNDFNANKTITIPGLIGRVPVGAGAAQSWSTIKTLGTPGGGETYTLVLGNLPSIPINVSGTITVTASGSQWQLNTASINSANLAGGSTNYPSANNGQPVSTGNNTMSGTAGGAATPFSTLPPYMPLNVMVKL